MVLRDENGRPLPAAAEPDAAVPGESSEETIERLERELAAKTEESAGNYDKFLRERAELENVRKRLQRDKVEALRFANDGLARDLLPVVDNLERAVEHAEAGGDGEPLIEGVRLVLRSALEVLERHGVKREDAVGQPFDPSRHEAIARVSDTETEPNRVVRQFLPGYFLHDRLLRAAQVGVSARQPDDGVEKAKDDD